MRWTFSSQIEHLALAQKTISIFILCLNKTVEIFKNPKARLLFI